jgi:hypothetical protein
MLTLFAKNGGQALARQRFLALDFFGLAVEVQLERILLGLAVAGGAGLARKDELRRRGQSESVGRV